jgi:hypothetical protein
MRRTRWRRRRARLSWTAGGASGRGRLGPAAAAAAVCERSARCVPRLTVIVARKKSSTPPPAQAPHHASRALTTPSPFRAGSVRPGWSAADCAPILGARSTRRGVLERGCQQKNAPKVYIVQLCEARLHTPAALGAAFFNAAKPPSGVRRSRTAAGGPTNHLRRAANWMKDCWRRPMARLLTCVRSTTGHGPPRSPERLRTTPLLVPVLLVAGALCMGELHGGLVGCMGAGWLYMRGDGRPDKTALRAGAP